MDTSPQAIKRVVFVCTGNTCRSPMAAAIFRHLAKEVHLLLAVESAGVAVSRGSKASAGAVRALASRKLSLKKHKSSHINDLSLHSDDLVLTMTLRQREAILTEHPALAGQVYVLKDYVGTDSGDVIDPFGGGQVEYEACASELEELIKLLVDKLQNQQQPVIEQQDTE